MNVLKGANLYCTEFNSIEFLHGNVNINRFNLLAIFFYFAFIIYNDIVQVFTRRLIFGIFFSFTRKGQRFFFYSFFFFEGET